MIFLVVLVPLKIMLLIWLMSQEWFWIGVAWLIGIAGFLIVMTLIIKALGHS